MNLRRKLLTTFGILALLGLVVAGVTIWAILQWQRSDELLQEHYERSLELQNIRAATFRAAMEIPEAVTGNDPDSRVEFEEELEPVPESFERWRALADSEEERREIAEVRDSYERVVEGSEAALDLVDEGRLDAASELFDERLEDEEFDQFQNVTERVERADLERRQEIRNQTEDTRRTAQLVLIVAAFGTVSLLFLVAAYLASDLFRPLRNVEQALDDVARGDLDRRLDEERSDEIGAVSRAFNRMVEAISEREQMGGMTAAATDGNGSAWRSTPSRVTLHRLVSQIRSRISNLDGGEAGAGQRELVGQLDRLSQAVARVTEFGFPLDLDLERTDVRELLYDVVVRFQEEFAERAVSLDLEIDAEVDHAVMDRLKLREALAELVRNALAALPERGGHVGLRARVSPDEPELLIEVADDGAGAEQSLIDEAFDPTSIEEDEELRTGLTLTNAIVEQHGGHLEIESTPGEGTYVQIRLPLRD